jgi:hypothetical protein
MTITELIAKLESFKNRHGDLDVLIYDPNDGTVCDCEPPVVSVAEEGQYPPDWNMPKGFTFVKFSP